MGLDVYLERTTEDLAIVNQIEREFNRRDEKLWNAAGDYDSLTDEQKDTTRKAIAEMGAALGTDEWGRHLSREKVEIDSRLYPDHYFKIGYFRSSYNDSGFNHHMKRAGLPNLYELFGARFDQPDAVPDWGACLENVNQSIEQYKAFLDSPMGKFDVMDICAASIFPNDVPENEAEALEMFSRNLKQHEDNGTFRAYSSSDGTFCLDGVKIFALIPGTQYKSPVVYCVYERPKEEWYLHALEIVKETIEYVLAQPDPQHYYLSWYG